MPRWDDPKVQQLLREGYTPAAIKDILTSGAPVGSMTNEWGLLSDLPANGSRPENSTYFATDQYGGTMYRMVSGVWVQQSAGVAQASGQIVAGPVLLTGSGFDVKAIGTTITDIPGMSLSIPASPNRPLTVHCRLSAAVDMGTATSGAVNGIWLLLRDSNNNNLMMDAVDSASIAAAFQKNTKLVIEYYLPAPVVAQTLKLSARTQVAVQANVTMLKLLPGWGVVGQSEPFYAKAA